MGTLLLTILAFVIVFGILVFVHELGHFMMGKLAGVRIEQFAFGFGPSLYKRKTGPTEYRINLIPLGGYVLFYGEQPKKDGGALEPDNLMAKTRWQRFLIMVMGAVMNILLAFGIFTAVNIAGVPVPEYLSEKASIGWIDTGSPAEKAGLRIDDEILRIDGNPVSNWNNVAEAVARQPKKSLAIDVRRENAKLSVILRTEQDGGIKFDYGYAGFYGKVLTEIRQVTANSPALRGGMMQGDVIQTINGEPVYLFKFTEVIARNPEKELAIGIIRGGRPMTLRVTPKREGEIGKIGVRQAGKSKIVKYGFWGALGKSFDDCVSNSLGLLDLLKKLFTGKASASRNLGGPLEIAEMSYSSLQMGFVSFLFFIGFISLQLGIINLLPIPLLPLDGTQIFILGIESAIRRDLNPKFKQIWMQVMFVVFFTLFAFLILNDIARRLPHGWESFLPFKLK
jgi:regulator of sigma E protease